MLRDIRFRNIHSLIFYNGRRSVEMAPILGRPQSAIDEDTIKWGHFGRSQHYCSSTSPRCQGYSHLSGSRNESQFQGSFSHVPRNSRRLITQGETWIDHYDPENKAQSKQRKHTLSRQGQEYSLLGPVWGSDDGFSGRRYFNYKSLIRFIGITKGYQY